MTSGAHLDAARSLFRHIDLFSRYVLGIPLYGYQLAPLQAIVDSVLNRRGYDFLLIFPRQSGKNEAMAHLFVFLFNVLQAHEGSIIFAAIGDSVGRGLRRLEERLDNDLKRGYWRKASRPLRRVLGKAAVVFLSRHSGAPARRPATRPRRPPGLRHARGAIRRAAAAGQGECGDGKVGGG